MSSDDFVPRPDRDEQEQPLRSEPSPASPPGDAEVPEADALESSQDVERPTGTGSAPRLPADAPEADALDQSLEVSGDEEDGAI
jgi:hypothetical protein